MMADCATLEEGIACAKAGADFVGTTMRGYTPETQGYDAIDYDFIRELSEQCPARIIAEGHIHYPEQAKKPGSRCLCAGSGRRDHKTCGNHSQVCICNWRIIKKLLI